MVGGGHWLGIHMNVAILIAVEGYCDKSIPKVAFAANDAYELGTALRAVGYELSDQSLLVNELATKSTIESKLRTTLRAITEQDTVLLFYAGHGFSVDGRNYLTCFDTQVSDLEATSFSLDSVLEQIQKSNASKTVLMLDVHPSSLQATEQLDGAITEFNHDTIRDSIETVDRSVCFMSCLSGETSWPNRQTKHGVWTQSIIEAINGRVPTAINDANLLTAEALHSHLGVAVPRTLRVAYADEKLQTPCSYGSTASHFMLADLADVIAASVESRDVHVDQVLRVSFVRERLDRIQDLAGFKKKTHRIPDKFDLHAEAFVARLATQDIVPELDKLYADLRQAFRFKRADMNVSDPGDGTGTIITPYFNYSVCATLHDDDPSEVFWTRRVGDIKQPEQVFADAFGSVFGEMFDTVEFNPPEPIDLEALIDRVEELDDDRIVMDYDRAISWCSLAIQGITGAVEVTATSLSIVQDKPSLPRDLLESFFEIQAALSKTFDVKAINFNAAVDR